MNTLAAILSAAFLLSFFLPSPPPPYFVGAYYYTWYSREYWARRGHLGPPLLGLYDTASPRVAEQHIRWAKKYGIDVFAWSFWGPGHYSEKNFQKGFLRARNVGLTKFSVFYEVDALGGRPPWDFDRPKIKDKFISDMVYAAKTYFPHRSYFKLGGRPVVTIYTTRTFTGDYQGAVREARAKIRELGYDVYFIGDEVWWGEVNAKRAACFDAVTGYNLYYKGIVEEGVTDTAKLAEKLRPLYQNWQKQAAGIEVMDQPGQKVVFQPGIVPQYDDSKVRGARHLPLPARTADDLVQMAKMAKEFLMAGTKKDQVVEPNAEISETKIFPPVVWITSFNEWHEGTSIEPTVPGDWSRYYGFKFLDVIKEVFKR